jgi:galactose oxidase
MAREVVGRWTELFKPEFNTVAVHASLLPNGKVLYWGRRQNPKANTLESLDEHFTKAFVWDPPKWVAPVWDPSTGKFGESKPTAISGQSIPTKNEPVGKKDGKPVNLFCSGHCFLPDGNLLVVGGHLKDTWGVNEACIYNPITNEFTPQTEMNNGRWYPSALPLPDGRVLSISGCFNFVDEKGRNNTLNNSVPQIWSPEISNPNTWTEVKDPFPDQSHVADLYPRVHLDPIGRVFVAGPQQQSWFIDIKDAKGVDIKADQKTVGTWTKVDKMERTAKWRDYAPSVMYDSGKIIYIGGGTDKDGPTTMAEFIDLKADTPKWTTTNMKNPRKQFNATVLPDGTVLVTGGTSGSGFNDLSTNATVHEAELWNPFNNTWTPMAVESADRCYHSIALLLPDGRVLSAGGGEYGDAKPDQCLTNAQLFEPPYLFKGPQPTISSAPSDIDYGKEISITVGATDLIAKVSWVRLGSVTHCRNMNQSLIFLEGLKQNGSKVTVRAPASANLAPPGHYMLFVLSQQCVPSMARIVRIPPAPASAPAKTSTPITRVADLAQHTAVAKQVQPSLLAHNERIITEQARPPVVVGLTPVCPYGLGACWGGAYDALQRVSDIEIVRPVPSQADSVAFVYLQRDILPDIDVWRSEFEKVVHKGYDMRGIEMTVSGVVTKKQPDADGQLTLASTSTRPQLSLAPFQATSQIKWDMTAKAARPISDAEAGAYKRLSATLADHPAGVTVQVTGTLQKHGANEFSLDVRDFEVPNAAAS